MSTKINVMQDHLKERKIKKLLLNTCMDQICIYPVKKPVSNRSRESKMYASVKTKYTLTSFILSSVL